MKRKLFTLALILLIISLSATGTYAYYSTQATAHNIITSGNVEIRLDEWFLNDDGVREPFEDRTVVPGQAASKIVEVTNTGRAAAYVRVLVSIAGAKEEHVSLDLNTECWTEKQADGYYYYKEALNPGESTKQPLFTTVTFDGSMGNEYSNTAVTIAISAQAVQVANQDAATPLEAKGWPDSQA